MATFKVMKEGESWPTCFVDADTVSEALHQVSQYKEIPMHNLVAVEAEPDDTRVWNTTGWLKAYD